MRTDDRGLAREAATALLRLALAAGFLSSLADRFGLWGPPGTPGVLWGDFARFEMHTSTLSPWTPLPLVSTCAWGLTIVEATLAVALLAGVWLRFAALVSAMLLLAVALATALFVGPKAALDGSLFSVAAGSLLLAAAGVDRWSLDDRRARLRRWLANAPA